MPLRSPELKIEAAERLSETAEAEPFESELQLKTDEVHKRPYKLKWDLETPSISVGVADDGTFLSDVGIQFTDLMGDHRIYIQAGSVSEFASYGATYLNLKNRFNWGASVFNYSDYFVDQSTGIRLQRRFQQTGVNVFINYPFSRYYRGEASLGYSNVEYPQYVGQSAGQPIYANIKDSMAIGRMNFIGDTTRYQSFGPFQGKRFSLGVIYGEPISSDIGGNWLEYRGDFRFYKQVTRRSLLAWRFSGVWNAGEREVTYGFGGLNQLRGYEFREFFGSRLAWMNMEYRFPLVDELRFPVLALNQIRGFFFLDAGGAWYSDDSWYDPLTRRVLADYSVRPAQIIPFEFWDSENGRFGQARGSYGAGFQFLFIGGLQFNWVWAKRLPYTQYFYDQNGAPVAVDGDTDDLRNEFYIFFDW
jgi:outer membrane protein assembly factor BamA